MIRLLVLLVRLKVTRWRLERRIARTGKPYGLSRNLWRSGRYANRGPPRVKGRPKSSSAASSRSSSQAYLSADIPAGFSG